MMADNPGARAAEGGRHSLVLGVAGGTDPGVPGRALGLHRALVGPGGWQGTAAAEGIALDPGMAGSRALIDRALAAAHSEGATLLLGIVSDAVRTEGTAVLLGHGSELLDLGAFVRELRERYRGIDGMILLLDAPIALPPGWTSTLAAGPAGSGLAGSGRIEVLAGTGLAADVMDIAAAGIRNAGSRITASDIRAASGRSGQSVDADDPALWILPNQARAHDVTNGSARATLIDARLAGFSLTPSQQRAAESVIEARDHRLVTITGAPSCGKSTVLAALTRPDQFAAIDHCSPRHVAAIVLVHAWHSVEEIAAEIATQLHERIPGLAPRPINGTVPGMATERLLEKPLAACATDWQRPLIVILDGIDQLPRPEIKRLDEAIGTLLSRQEGALARLRIIVSIRDMIDLATLPSLASGLRAGLLGDPAWLPARLGTVGGAPAVELEELVARRVQDVMAASSAPEAARLVLALLLATGAAPILPRSIIETALAMRGLADARAFVGEVLALAGPLAERAAPGASEETVGLSRHAPAPAIRAVVDPAGTAMAEAHRAIVDAAQHLSTTAATRGSAATAAFAAHERLVLPYHCLHGGLPEQALALLSAAAGNSHAADNQARWSRWSTIAADVLGPSHPVALSLRGNAAGARGIAGDPAGAAEDFTVLASDREQLLGAEHPDTIATRNNVAVWLGKSGQHRAAAAEFAAMLPVLERLHGPAHPATVATRDHLNHYLASMAAAVATPDEARATLRDQQRVLGREHRATLASRFRLATMSAASGDHAAAITQATQVLHDQRRILGPAHPDVLETLHSLASWRHREGDHHGALTDLIALAEGRAQLLGDDHPETLAARGGLARAKADAGELHGVIKELEDLVPLQQRVLGADHPDTLAARNNLALSRGKVGEIERSLREFGQLLADRERVLGPEHPATLTTRANLAWIKGRNGDAAAALRAYEELIPLLERVLGGDHPRVAAARKGRARWAREISAHRA
ncbi:tetratricopeptide repeat protein [Lolliginicoccus levis]|uniref:tetratricopeptide repeat protein n=1 Tax=Lolliginicoccus levis TaxID=2919542 RepID=UPI00241E275D|nr:tetratricopeptide repeat protein [Lolliginicoccus levis]